MPLHETQVTVWIASNGAEFRRIDQAVAYERQLQITKILDNGLIDAPETAAEIVFSRFDEIKALMEYIEVIKGDQNAQTA